MQDTKIAWISDLQLPRHSMGRLSLSLAPIRRRDVALPVSCLRSSARKSTRYPEPAFRAKERMYWPLLVHSGPELLSE